MGEEILFGLSFVFEVGSVISIALLVISFFIIEKIKKLFPGGNIVKKWIAMQVIIITFLVLQIIDWILIFFPNEEYLDFMVAGFVNILIGIFVILIVYLSYNTYQIILGKKET